MDKNISNMAPFYSERASKFAAAIVSDKKIRIAAAFIKLALFLCFAVSFIFTIKGYPYAVYFIFLFLAAFIAAAVSDEKFERRYLKKISLKKLNEAEAAQAKGDLAPFREGKEYIDPKHEYSFDLDLFESGSLFQHINRTATKEGEEKLAHKLLNIDKNVSEINENSQAVKELAEMADIRQYVTVLGFDKQISLAGLPSQSEAIKKAKIGKPIVAFSYFSVLATFTAIILYLFKIVPSFVPFTLFMFQLALSAVYFFKVNAVYAKLNEAGKNAAGYAEIASIIKSAGFKSKKLKNIWQNSAEIEKEIGALRKILNEFDQRNNILIYIAVNGLLLRDIFSANKTCLWFEKNDKNIEGWLTDISLFDALCSLGTFAFNNPDFVFPEINSEGKIMKAADMCHPLISKEKRVGNDFSVNGKGEFFIITGANMAGKSTFIRSVGVNMILAACGAPVCAASFSFLPTPIFTSMRTSDKLLESSSYFQAELARLKTMKENVEKETITLVLMDEILKGTNSEDKLNGSKLVLAKLADMNAAGLLSTHDTALHTLEKEMPENFHNYSFEFEVGGDGELIFDYKLRKGVSKNMNAGILLKRIFTDIN